jgi:hypothetical protein
LRDSTNSSRNSPFLFSALGASSVTDVLSGSCASSSTTSAADRAITGPPHW